MQEIISVGIVCLAVAGACGGNTTSSLGGDGGTDGGGGNVASGGRAEGGTADEGGTTDVGGDAPSGGQGWGTDSPCGRGGTLFPVRVQADLDACIRHDGPRTCVFETSGTFTAPEIRNPYLTIAGQTAPSPGIQITPGILVSTHDVCVFHTRFRGDGNIGDVVKLSHRQIDGEEQTHDIWFDHISVSWSRDENFSSWCGPGAAIGDQPGVPDGYVRRVTLSHAISSHGLLGHSMGFLAARPGHEDFSVIGNVFAHNGGRNPKLGNGRFVVANNLIYNHGGRAIAMGSSGGVFDGYVAHNAVVRGPNTAANAATLYGETGNAANNDLYLEDNREDDDAPADPASLLRWIGSNLSVVSTPQDWATELDLQLLPSGEVFEHNLACAGARPLDRDAIDSAVIADIRDGGGTHIAEPPAPPDLDGVSHTLPSLLTSTDPQDWTRDSDADGVTDVEDELRRMAAELECSR